ncbi:MAG: nucleotidyltransferase family protein [Candidatus Omnitrophica bacterium]|nr:nucleotidyltransferase family protein [Candidatus Omnitrophota bacterium]MDD5429930.1 nucleotidyltransferase family protein [Candidatus Omnitrophota bacterium]
MKNVEKLFTSKSNTIEEVIAVIQKGAKGIALIVDQQQRLIGTVTDGDIRRAILAKIDLKDKITSIFEQHCIGYNKPIAALIGVSREEILKIMGEKSVRHVPLLDKAGRVKDLAWISDLIEDDPGLQLTAIVMAGGKGRRLHPFTKDTPKPMLPLSNRPLMERTIERLRECGIKKVHISTHYKPEAITNHFGNGNNFGVDIGYINEDQPLGTAGALSLMESPHGPTLVINGDVLTQLDFRAMHDFHNSHKAVMTVGVRKCDLEVPYGVIETNNVDIVNLVEKPIQTFLVNAGIYLLEPIAYKYIPKNHNFDMTELVEALIEAGQRVISFPIQEYWLDIGHPEHYQKAKEDVKNGKI